MLVPLDPELLFVDGSLLDGLLPGLLLLTMPMSLTSVVEGLDDFWPGKP